MTAEIAIMNKEAVALAADSAVTIGTRGGAKIYNTVNKLFALSKHQPVGVMIYGRADLMGVPWESVIKLYRRHLGTRSFARLRDYVDHFFDFLGTPGELFPAEVQSEHFYRRCTEEFHALREQIEKRVEQIIDKDSSIDVKGVSEVNGINLSRRKISLRRKSAP